MQRILTGSCQPSQKNWSCSRFLLRVDVVQYFVIPSFALFLIIHLLYNLLILTIFFVFLCSYFVPFVYRTIFLPFLLSCHIGQAHCPITSLLFLFHLRQSKWCTSSKVIWEITRNHDTEVTVL